jgi:hypothetical protein
MPKQEAEVSELYVGEKMGGLLLVYRALHLSQSIILYFSILLHCVFNLGVFLFRLGATSSFSDPLLENTYLQSTACFGLTGHLQVCIT